MVTPLMAVMGYSRPLNETATAITDPLSADKTGAPQAHGPDTHQDLLALANKTLLASQALIAEIELLLRELSTRSKKLASTGVPMFLRSLQASHALARQALDDLSPSSPSSSSLLPDEASLLKAHRKVDTSAVDVSRAATHWAILKRCSSLVAIHQAFQGSAKTTRGEEISRMPSMSPRQRELMHRTLKQQAKVEVHVVASGSEWLHVRTLQTDRLARQMSDAGWNWGQHDSESDELPGKEVVLDEDEWADVPLAKQVRRLIAAAKLHRHEYRIPRLRIVLPNIGDENPDINLFLGLLSRMDPAVHVTVEVQTGEFLSRGPPAAVEDAIRNLVGCPLEGLTETLNLDHSILVALASDMTHLRVVSERGYSAATRAQIEEEARHEGGSMAKVLYPILQGRKLVCTPEAAEHFHHVLRLVGTASECERGELLVPLPLLGSQAQMSPCNGGREAFRARFRELSVHEMPSAVDLPITVMAECWRPNSLQEDVDEGALPGVALDVVRHCGFSAAKLSVFMYGWRSGNVTLSCNREVKAQFRTLVEMYRRGEDDYGPLIWGVDVARNLLGRGAGEAFLAQTDISQTGVCDADE
ncbi:hypothetical protein E4U15_004308 [Claviceps sp. LM218 group G6]|nr:hypothetical protein E4U15_004308 [Claviceps sp. LM218 group G6]